jgi:hypothetical protein
MEVKSVGSPGQKSVQEIDQEFEDQKQATEATEAAEAAAAAAAAAEAAAADEESETELNDDQVVNYFKKKHGRELTSIDELLKTPESKESDLPEAVASFAKFHKETNRGIEDYLRLNRDLDKVDEMTLIREHRRSLDPDLTDEEIDFEIDQEFGIDSDLDAEDPEHKRILLKIKKEARQAKKLMETQKEEYYKPIESTGGVPKEELEGYNAYKQKRDASKGDKELADRKTSVFVSETDKVFSEGFQGFEMKIDDKVMMFKPGDANELKSLQSSPSNFINKYLDEDGVIKDAAGYHRALAFAMNDEKAAKFFYEKGAADATESGNKKLKNVNYSAINKSFGGVGNKVSSVVSVSPKSSNSLKIKSNKT